MQYKQEMSKARELAEEALTLSEEARMYIVDTLRQSTAGNITDDWENDNDDCEADDVDRAIEAEWAEVAERRWQDYLAGRVQAIDGQKVMEEAYQLLKS